MKLKYIRNQRETNLDPNTVLIFWNQEYFFGSNKCGSKKVPLFFVAHLYTNPPTYTGWNSFRCGAYTCLSHCLSIYWCPAYFSFCFERTLCLCVSNDGREGIYWAETTKYWNCSSDIIGSETMWPSSLWVPSWSELVFSRQDINFLLLWKWARMNPPMPKYWFALATYF